MLRMLLYLLFFFFLPSFLLFHVQLVPLTQMKNDAAVRLDDCIHPCWFIHICHGGERRFASLGRNTSRIWSERERAFVATFMVSPHKHHSWTSLNMPSMHYAFSPWPRDLVSLSLSFSLSLILYYVSYCPDFKAKTKCHQNCIKFRAEWYHSPFVLVADFLRFKAD